jgi:YegS/Rv2252/BmrU family lipid kinase
MVRFEAMARTLRATVMVNPAARGVGADFDGSRLTRYLAKRGTEAALVLPASEADATHEARRSAARVDDLLFVVGGDGSVRAAARGLAGSDTALAAVPAGTVNIWARESGVPSGLRAALDAHLSGQSVHMDLGRAGEHCFLLMAGIGWDAEIAGRVSQRLKKRTGDIAYMAQAAWMAPRLRARKAAWQAGEQRWEEPLAWMVLGNTRLYGGRVRLTNEAVIDDGQLDGIALCPRGVADTARLARKIALGKREDDRMLSFRASEVVIESAGFPVQLDGDPVGETPMTFTVDPRALLVSVPRGPLAPIFDRPHVNRRKS